MYHAHLLVEHLLSVIRIDPAYIYFIYRIALYLSSSIFVDSSAISSTPVASMWDYVLSSPKPLRIECPPISMHRYRPHEEVVELLHLLCPVEVPLLLDHRKPVSSLLWLLVVHSFWCFPALCLLYHRRRVQQFSLLLFFIDRIFFLHAISSRYCWFVGLCDHEKVLREATLGALRAVHSRQWFLPLPCDYLFVLSWTERFMCWSNVYRKTETWL